MKRKIHHLKKYHSSLMEMLSDMLAEHFPLPDPQGNGSKKKRVSRSDNFGFDLFVFFSTWTVCYIWILDLDFQAAAYDAAEINLISLSEIIEVCSDTHQNKPFLFIFPPYVCNLLKRDELCYWVNTLVINLFLDTRCLMY